MNEEHVVEELVEEAQQQAAEAEEAAEQAREVELLAEHVGNKLLEKHAEKLAEYEQRDTERWLEIKRELEQIRQRLERQNEPEEHVTAEEVKIVQQPAELVVPQVETEERRARRMFRRLKKG